MCKYLILALLLPLTGTTAFGAEASATSAAVFGPPALCVPFEIGEATTVPLKLGGDYTRATLVDRVIEVLDRNERTLVHMETLRRGALTIRSVHHGVFLGESRASALRSDLLSRLRSRVERAEAAPEPVPAEVLGRLWFDLAFAQGALQQALRSGDRDCVASMEQALLRLESDGAAHLGSALALWEWHPAGEDSWQSLLLTAWRLEPAGDADLAANLSNVGAHLCQESDRERMIAKLKAAGGLD